MAALRIRLLGLPDVEVGGKPLAVDTRKAVALLAYLAVTGRPHSREALADLFWPNSDPESARAALRRTLSVLGKGLGGRWLLTRRESVTLDLEGVELDVARFRAQVDEGRLADAVRLARGDFMEGFGLRDSAAFDDWQLAEARALRRELAAALEQAARQLVERGDLPAAIGYASRLLELDELQEPSHRLLIELYARSGDRAAAIAQYRRCVRVLHRELGVTPLEETTALYEAVSAGRVARASAAAPSERAPAPTLPFVGRSEELAALQDVHRAAAADGRLVLVAGEPGIGKSRLVEELVARARAAGADAVLIRASERESGFAYGVVLEALRAVAGERLAAAPGPSLAEAARLVPELAALHPDLPALPSLDPEAARSRFVAGVADTLGAGLAAAPPGLLVVDDAHWADGASLEVVEYLARRLAGRPLCVALTWRPEELPSEHPLRVLARELPSSVGPATVTLGRLGPEAVEELARAAGAAPLAGRLYAETEGLPLLVVEYLAVLREAAGDEVPARAGIVELLRSRLARLGDAARQVLAAAAVLGVAFDPELVRDVGGRSDEETVGALEELCRRGLLAEGEGGYALAHERLREAVLADTSLARRRLLHRRAAEALSARTRRDPAALAGPIAEHLRLAGRDEDAAELHRLAGERARALFANAEAVSHLRAALALGHPDSPALHEAIGDLLTLLAEYRQAIESYEAAAALADGSGLARLEHKLGSVHHRRGEWDLAERHFAAATAGLADPGALSRLAADRSLNEHRRGRVARARSLARRALELATQAGDPGALAHAHNRLGILAASRGSHRTARRELERSLAHSAALADPSVRVAALNNLALVARAEGQLGRATELTRSALELCAARGDRHREAALRNNLADLLHAAGDDDDAMEELKRAVAIFAEIGGDPAEARAEIWKLVDW